MANGGIRHLENGEFRLVHEAVQERNRMIENASHLVRPLPTTIPIFKYGSRCREVAAARPGMICRLGITPQCPIEKSPSWLKEKKSHTWMT